MVDDAQAPVGEQGVDGGVPVRVELRGDEFGFQQQRAASPLDAEDLVDQREQVPARRTGQIWVHPAPAWIDVFGNAGIHPADGEIAAVTVDIVQRLVSFVDQPAPVKGVGVHHGHVAEHRPVFLVTVSVAEAAPQVEQYLAEIGVEPVAAHSLRVEIAIRRRDNRARLFRRRHVAEQGEGLPGERHPHAVRMIAFDALPVLVVVAVEPAAAFRVLQPFLFLQVRRQPIGFGGEVCREAFQADRDLLAGDGGLRRREVSVQARLFGGDVGILHRLTERVE